MNQNENENIEEIQNNNIQYVITKFSRRGMESLSLEDLAVALITPDFAVQFKKQTGVDWVQKYQLKAIERLQRGNFDLQWMTRKSKDIYQPLFQACGKGLIANVRDFLRKSDENVLYAVNQSKKSPLHVAAREGHDTVVELLIQKGFNVNARDRLLRTPLHMACIGGYETTADIILKKGGINILEARDSIGRTALHFGSCSSSSQLLTLLIGLMPELIHRGDNTGRLPLHYAVWNSTVKQVDIIRTLLDNHANINQGDDDGRTPLHHAAEGGRSRAIPILLQRGADIGIRENIQKKTPLEMAANDRVRELIIVYSATPFNPNQEDLKWMNDALKGQSVIVKKPFKGGISGGVVMQQQENKQKVQKVDSMNVAQGTRDRLFDLMKRIQEHGVSTYQHLKKPYLFSGSWMDGIYTIEILFDRLRELTPSEAAIRIFNVLCPYDQQLPAGSGEEPILSGFYGDLWEFQQNAQIGGGVKGNIQQQQQLDSQAESALRLALEVSNKSLEQREQEVEVLRSQKDDLTKELFALKLMLAKQQATENKMEEVRKDMDNKQEEIQELRKEIRKLNMQIQERNLEIEILRDQQGDSQQLEDAFMKIEQLEKENNEILRKDRALRYKAGQLFLKITEDQSKQIQKLQQNQDMMGGEQVDEEEASLYDDQAILNLYEALKNTQQQSTLYQRLISVDKNLDGKLSRVEFRQAMERIKLSPQDVLSLQRIAGFKKDGVDLIDIKEFLSILDNRPQARERAETQLFKKILDCMSEQNISINDLFDLLDLNNDQNVTFSELQKGIQKLSLNLNRKDMFAIFNVLDENKNGSIQLEELTSRLNYYQLLFKKENNIKENNNNNNEPLNDSEFEVLQNSKLKITTSQIGTYVLKNFMDMATTIESQPLIGELKIQIPAVSNLGNDIQELDQFGFIIQLLGSAEPKSLLIKQIENQNKWNCTFRIPILYTLLENLSDDLNIQLFKTPVSEIEENFLGEVQIKWKKCIEFEEQWVINQSENLQNISYKNLLIQREIVGQIKIQARYIPHTSKFFKSQINVDDFKIYKKSFKPLKKEQGRLEVCIVSGVSLRELTVDDMQKLYCQVELPEKDEEKLKPELDAKNQPIWNKILTTDLTLSDQKEVKNIYISLKKKKGMMSKDEQICECYIDWSDCLQSYRGDYHPWKAFLMRRGEKQDPIFKIYCRLRWIEKSELERRRQSSSSAQALQQQQQQQYKQGTLKINVVRGRNLIAKDSSIFSKASSDPYVKVTILDKEKTYVRTKTREKTLNPQFKEQLVLKVRYLSEGTPPPLLVEVIDYDTLGDDLMGSVKIDMKLCVDNPCTWAYNQYWNLQNAENKNKEQIQSIYLQMYYVPDGVNDPNIKPEDIDGEQGVKEEIQQIEKISGFVKVYVVCARNLLPDEKDTSDPLVLIKFPNQQTIETSYKAKDLDPIWKELKNSKPFSVPKFNFQPLILEIKDHDLGSDDLLGTVTIPLDECLEKPGKWAINRVFEIKGNPDLLKKQKKNDAGDIYVMIQFVEEGMIDDKQLDELIFDPEADLIKRKPYLDVIKGTLIIHLVHCKNLLSVESNGTSDPYVEFILPQTEKKESKKQVQTVNPIFKEMIVIPIQIPRIDLEPMKVRVYDYNKVLSNVLLGECEVDLNSILENGGIWSYNKIVQLRGNKELLLKNRVEQYGEIYMQIKYLKQGEKDDGKVCPLKEDLEGFLMKERESVVGKLIIIFQHGKGLLASDSGLEGKLSDPYPRVQLPNGKYISGDKKTQTLNPIWRQRIPVKINEIRASLRKPIRIEILDYDLGGDDLLGYYDLDWRQCVENPMQWIINDSYQLDHTEKLKQDKKIDNFGSIYIQVKYVPEGQNDDENENELEIKENIDDIVAQEKEKVVGKLNIYVYYARHLIGVQEKECSPFVRYKLPDDEKYDTKTLKGMLDPIWRHRDSKLLVIQKCDISKPIRVEVYDDNMLSNTLLGWASIKWDVCYQQPCEWVINDVFPLQNDSKKIQPNPLNNYGEIYVGIRYLREDKEDDNGIPELKYNIEQVIGEENKLVEGILCVHAIHAKGLLPSDTGILGNGKADPYVKVIMPNGQTQKCKQIDNTLIPIWKQMIKIPFKEKKKNIQGDIVLEVRDEDTGSIEDDLMGWVNIKLKQCVDSPNKWVINDIYQLQQEKEWLKQRKATFCGELYVQAIFISKDSQQQQQILLEQYPTLIQDIQREQEEAAARIKGQFCVYLVHADNLVQSEQGKKSVADPYCVFKLPNGKTIQSKVIKKELRPIFKQYLQIQVDISKEQMREQVQVVVKDEDFFGDDFLGFCNFGWQVCYENPMKWVIDNIYILEGSIDLQQKLKRQEFGELYFKAKYVPEGQVDDKQVGQLIKDLEVIKQRDNEKIQGIIYLYIVYIKDICNPDDGKPYKSIKTYVTVNLPESKETLKSQEKKEFIYKQEIYKNITITRADINKNVTVKLYEVVTLLPDKLLGSVDINIKACFEETETWATHDLYTLINIKNGRQVGQAYLMFQFAAQGKNPNKEYPIPKIEFDANRNK